MPEPLDLDDLLAPLRSPGADGPPARDVRRRGDRLRRRRTTARGGVALAAVAALAALAVPQVSGGDSGGRAIDPATSAPRPTAPAEPAADAAELTDADLASGLRGEVTYGDALVRGSNEGCVLGVRIGRDSGAARVRSATVEQTEGVRARTVVEFESADEARAVLDGITALGPGCDESQTNVLEDGAATIRIARAADGSGTVTRVDRIGRWVLVDVTDALGLGDPDVVQQTADLLTTQATTLEARLAGLDASSTSAGS